ncbi:hypothetical protein RND71_042011 [Anisodus tanguticus]|uniref:DUF4283 domain-containing protein n=1 Tax=Anisodus tanguticus TaxID=243964 RepID=A0AAE1UUF0_9SOLA|nr:hypothetical protein RND71_042011 [Anisodus tanguticus]
MEVEEKELGEDASVDQPGQIVVQEKEPSPIAIEASGQSVQKRRRCLSGDAPEKKKKPEKETPIISETANGGNPRPCGDPSPMSIPIPIKPIVYLHGEPTIRFEKKEVEVMIHHQELTLAIVGKFSHGWPDIAFLRNAIPKQCGLKAEVRIGLLCDRHVLIRCSIVEYFDTLMSRQTFEIKEKNKPYVMRTFKWDISFNPAEESRFAYGWISFPGLSPHYYGESTLFSLAAAVGSPIAIDSATLNKTRPSCARVKVEFDLLKNHPQHVVIQVGEGDGITSELQKIRYDFKPKYCTNCKLQGHDVDGCWNLQPALRPEKAKEIDGGKVAKAVEMAVAIGKGKASIPTSSSSNPSQQAPISTTNALIQHPSNNWITVTRKNKKNKNQYLKPPSKPTGTVTPATGIVFSESRDIGATVQVSKTVFPPKNDPPKFSDAGNPTGIFGGAGNPTGDPPCSRKPPTRNTIAHPPQWAFIETAIENSSESPENHTGNFPGFPVEPPPLHLPKTANQNPNPITETLPETPTLPGPNPIQPQTSRNPKPLIIAVSGNPNSPPVTETRPDPIPRNPSPLAQSPTNSTRILPSNPRQNPTRIDAPPRPNNPKPETH